jgi:putative CocE/NonD family hydrolase
LSGRRPAALVAVCLLGLSAAASADAAETSQRLLFRASDGVALQATVSGEEPLAPRPLIVEFSPYGRDTATADAGPAYNHLLVQIRGTGESAGRFDSLGPRTQRDVVEVLRWACRQPWSNGDIGLNGFSASAITIYNSLHRKLPCVRTAVLKSGTYELYRDLLYPGGISNLIPGLGVLALIGVPGLLEGSADGSGSPADALAGMLDAFLGVARHPTLDSWWRERGFRGDVNRLPTLVINGFFDVESRGAFQAFQELRDDGAQMLVIGAHDLAPEGTDGGAAATKAWFDHHLLGTRPAVARRPAVRLWLADGDREDQLAGDFVRRNGADWPLPGTRWQALALDPARSGSANSLNDGSLSLSPPTSTTAQSYPALPSVPFNSDPYNTAIIGGFGFNALTTAMPILSEMALAEPLGLSYTTAPLRRDVLAVGPGSVELRLSTSGAQTGLWAVISDVWPDGSVHPIGAGRLLSDYPLVDRSRSLKDPRSGAIVQPYGRYDQPLPATPGEERLYRIELWPIGNRFKAGHRIRLHIVGASAASLPTPPALNTVSVGGAEGSRLLFPVLRGSSLRRALGGG